MCTAVVRPTEPERLPASDFIVGNPYFSRAICGNSMAEIFRNTKIYSDGMLTINDGILQTTDVLNVQSV